MVTGCNLSVLDPGGDISGNISHLCMSGSGRSHLSMLGTVQSLSVVFSCSVVPYSQALNTLVLSCFEAGDQKDEAEPGATIGVGALQCPDQQCHSAGVRRPLAGQLMGWSLELDFR